MKANEKMVDDFFTVKEYFQGEITDKIVNRSSPYHVYNPIISNVKHCCDFVFCHCEAPVLGFNKDLFFEIYNNSVIGIWTQDDSDNWVEFFFYNWELPEDFE